MSGIRRRNPVTVSGCRFCQVPACSGRNRINPVTGSVSRNTASTFRRFPVFSCRIRPVLLDLGCHVHVCSFLCQTSFFCVDRLCQRKTTPENDLIRHPYVFEIIFFLTNRICFKTQQLNCSKFREWFYIYNLF